MWCDHHLTCGQDGAGEGGSSQRGRLRAPIPDPQTTFLGRGISKAFPTSRLCESKGMVLSIPFGFQIPPNSQTLRRCLGRCLQDMRSSPGTPGPSGQKEPSAGPGPSAPPPTNVLKSWEHLEAGSDRAFCPPQAGRQGQQLHPDLHQKGRSPQP